jgi:glycogen operon protein
MNSAPLTPLPGRPEPWGAWARDGGVNFAVFAAHAGAVQLCLFDGDGRETGTFQLHGPNPDGLWHGFVPGLAPGQLYGLRAHGPWAPAEGHRYNPHKLLLDPAAQEIAGSFAWRSEHHGYVLGQDPDTAFEASDNAAWALKARVPAPLPPLKQAKPRIHAAERVLYEVHVKGFSQQHPGIPPELRGTYAALAHPVALAHFQRLGVTTLSLLPVHYALNEPMLPPGLVNYWGYNTLGFFCPTPRYSGTPQDPAAVNAEFRAMVDALHAHGLEVVLDVVYNHTPEGNRHGPTLSFRGLDQRSWYRLDEAGRPLNWSACGNTLNFAHPQVVAFTLASLRHWVQTMGVDGFRFDLAAVLGRGADGSFDREHPFFRALETDPVLKDALLIAEPWDAGPQGYRVGGFPGHWLEWHDRFRDAANGYWLHKPTPHGEVTRAEFAARFDGSAETYRDRHPAQARAPQAGVNYLAVHDGYTLADLVAYERKHNQANGENNRDGRDNEVCANFGVEGPSSDPAIQATRLRVRRALVATLLLAAGTPMLGGGDEVGNTQHGNNNAWSQDNATGWITWPDPADAPASAEAASFTRFVAELISLRRTQPLLRPGAFDEIVRHWEGLEADDTTPLLCHLHEADARDAPAPLMIAFNRSAAALPLALPPGRWQVLLCSEPPELTPPPATADAPLPPRGLRVLQRLR